VFFFKGSSEEDEDMLYVYSSDDSGVKGVKFDDIEDERGALVLNDGFEVIEVDAPLNGSNTTKKLVFWDGIFGRKHICLKFSDGFGTVLKERNFCPKSVPKACEIFMTCLDKVFSHKFRTNFLKKTNPSQNRVKY